MEDDAEEVLAAQAQARSAQVLLLADLLRDVLPCTTPAAVRCVVETVVQPNGADPDVLVEAVLELIAPVNGPALAAPAALRAAHLSAPAAAPPHGQVFAVDAPHAGFAERAVVRRAADVQPCTTLDDHGFDVLFGFTADQVCGNNGKLAGAWRAGLLGLVTLWWPARLRVRPRTS
jgi:hypothetical protein